MPDKAEALGILLVLLPGFACSYIVQLLAVRRKQSELDKVVEALLFSLFFYLVSLPFFGNTLPLSWRVQDAGHPDQYQVLVHWQHLLFIAGLAIVSAFAYGIILNLDILARVLSKIHLSVRSSRVNIWNEAFEEIDGFVQVGLSGERKVIGWVRNFSDEEGVYELFLEDAAWVVGKDGEQQPINGPGILLTKDSGIEYVVFLYEDEGQDRGESTTPASLDEPH